MEFFNCLVKKSAKAESLEGETEFKSLTPQISVNCEVIASALIRMACLNCPFNFITLIKFL